VISNSSFSFSTLLVLRCWRNGIWTSYAFLFSIWSSWIAACQMSIFWHYNATTKSRHWE